MFQTAIMTEDTPATPVSGALKSVSNTPVATNSPLRSKDVLLPLARVKTIMKSSPDVENIGQESLFLITKVMLQFFFPRSSSFIEYLQATELFIMYLTKLSQRHENDEELTYTDLASVVQKKDSMEFLHDIIPKKIKYSEYLKLVEEAGDEENELF